MVHRLLLTISVYRGLLAFLGLTVLQSVSPGVLIGTTLLFSIGLLSRAMEIEYSDALTLMLGLILFVDIIDLMGKALYEWPYISNIAINLIVIIWDILTFYILRELESRD